MIPESIGPYRVLGKLGAGGMGEVYRARDVKLNRDVAIKVLPDLFSADPDRLARFRREAQVLASLNHPNIGHIYGLEDSSGAHALVLELIEGPTLADRIAQGPIPLDEAIPIARQIADALECAHEQGIVHRDLKPANIKLRPDGTVKVLDFGLAKALDPTASSPDAMNSPTLTARGTQLGIIVGTAAYMAPEQARGRAVDRRADIWAFGVVLYEMLSGKRAFEGDDVSITLAAVLKDDVDWKVLPANLPPSVLWVLRRCMEKDPKRRLSAIGDARLELDTPLPDTRPPAERPSWPLALIAVVCALAGAGLAALVVWAPWRVPVAPPLTSVSIETGTSHALFTGIGGSLALSPDGRTLAFVALEKGVRWIFVRRLDELQATRLPGTEDAMSAFFSPDGASIAFFTSNHLKRVAVTGGAATNLTTAGGAGGRGGAWSEDGTIVFQPTTAPFSKLMRVADTGGTPVPLVARGVDNGAQRWPDVLPGGRAVLYTANLSPTGWDNANVVVQPLPAGPPRTIVEGGYYARYVASGHVLYIKGGTLFAVPFDADRLERTGGPVPVREGIAGNPVTGGAHYAVAGMGTLAYVPGIGAGEASVISLIDASGKTTTLHPMPLEWMSPRFSPTGDRIALVARRGDTNEVHVYDAARGQLERITFEPGSKAAPVWGPRGERVVYSVSAPGVSGALYSRRADGTGEVQQLTAGPHAHTAYSFDPTGKYLAISERDANGTPDIVILPLDGDESRGWKAGPPRSFLKTPVTETYPMFSPDGRWIAYMANAGGRAEIYVRPVTGAGGPWQISTGGGLFPTWSNASDEILYVPVDTPTTLMATSFTVVGDSFRTGRTRPWSAAAFRSQRPGRMFDLHPDGKRIVGAVAGPESDQEQRAIVLLFNFVEKLRGIVQGK